MKNFSLALCLLLLTQFFLIINPAKAQGEEERFKFCSRFPQNSKCEGYTAPIPLEDRSGEEAECFLEDQESGDECKVQLESEILTLYIETGDNLDILDNEKSTKELAIPLTAIESFAYSEDDTISTGRVLTFGLIGLLSKKKISAFEFTLQPLKDDAEQKIPNQAFLVLDRDEGENLLEEIEEKTQLSAEILDSE